MNKKLFSIFAILIFVSATNVFSQKTVLTEEDYSRAEKMLRFNTAQFVDRSMGRPNWLSDGRFWYETKTSTGIEYVLINPADGGRKVFGDKEVLTKETADKSLARTIVLPNNGNVSPDRKKAVYIRDWNLYVIDLETEEHTQLTKDGVENFGYATDNAGWRKSDRPIVLWSPDSKQIATFQQDQRNVSDMYLVSTKVGEPELQAWKYPIPTDKEIIQIHRVIIDVDSAKVTRLKMPPDARRGTLCDDIACTRKFDDNEWNAEGSKLAFVSSSRNHKEAKLRIADSNTGEVRDVLEEIVKTQYESGQGKINWSYLPETTEFIWYSERSDWGHLYLYDGNGRQKNQITSGDFVVTRVQKVDVKNRVIYFEANGKEKGRDPYFSHFYSVGFDGKNLKLLTPEDGNHRLSFSPDGKYFIDQYSTPVIPDTYVLRDMNGKLIVTLEKMDISRLKATGWKPPIPITVKDRTNKWDLYGLMFTPTHLDPKKKYPVVNYIYPGPQGGGVGSRSFSPSRSDHQSVAELGFVVVVIDGSCNPNRSKSFHDSCYGDMADNTLPDQISGLRQLAKNHSFMDLDRVGVWGHSGGGFATAAALFRYPDFYKVGISESGNHDNRNYEDDWGERYIGLVKGDNYEKQANQIYAKNLKGKLLLAHGGLDDNVPPYNTYLVAEALIKANKDFDLLIFPNARHGYGRDSLYMMRRRWDYFVTHLLGATPPKEYQIKITSDSR